MTPTTANRLLLRVLAGACLASSPALLAQSYTFTHLAGSRGGPGTEDGIGSAARFGEPAAIVSNQAGAFFVADRNAETIRKVDGATGAVTTAAGTVGSWGPGDGHGAHAQFNSPGALAFDGPGQVYIAERNTTSVRSLNIATGVVTTIVPSGLGYGLKGLAADGVGNLYVADSGANVIRKLVISSGTMTTLAGTGAAGFGNGPASTATFDAPSDLAYDGNHILYVVDRGSSLVRSVDLLTLSVGTIAGAAYQTGPTDGPLLGARFTNPEGIAWDAAGVLWVADTGNHTVRCLALGNPGSVTTPAGLAGSPGSADGIGPNARFSSPSRLSVDESGRVGIADTGNHTVRVLVPQTKTVSTLAGAATESGSVDAKGDQARFASPSGVAVDAAGNAYVSDWDSHVVRRVDPAGNVTTIAGLAGSPGSADGTGSQARFHFPFGLALDGDGNLYVADYGNSTIRRIELATGMVSTFAGQAGGCGFRDGFRTDANLCGPTALAFDGQRTLWFLDTWDGLRKIDLGSGWVVTTSANTGTNPHGLAADGANVYVSSFTNDTVVRYDRITGLTSLLAGAYQQGAFADGPGTEARFYGPMGLALDGAGHLLVADSGETALRSIDLASSMVSTIAGNPWSPGSTDGTGTEAHFVEPVDVAVSPDGRLWVVDDLAQNVRVGKAALPDRAVIDAGVGSVGQPRSLDAVPATATAWSWEVIRRPSGSTAQLSDASVRNPTFVPDVADRYDFRATATNATGASITSVTLGAGEAAMPPTAVVSGGATVCSGSPGDVTVALTGTPPWRVVFSDGVVWPVVSSSPLVRHAAPAATTVYTVASVADAFLPGTASGSATVTDLPLPPAPTISAPAAVLLDASGLTASVPLHAGSTYSWSIMNGSISSGSNANAITFGVFNGGPATLTVWERDANQCTSPTARFQIQVLDSIAPLQFYTVNPCRMLDTRDSVRLGAYQSIVVSAGTCGVPADARSIAANVTAVNPSEDGSLTVYPGSGPLKETVAVAFRAGQIRASAGSYTLRSTAYLPNSLTVYNGSTGLVDVLIDVSGFYK